MPTPGLAYLGYVGYVEIDTDSGKRRVRATSADVRANQDVTTPDLVDGKFDRTTYQLGPIEVGGNIAFPAVYEDGDTVTTFLWQRAVERGSDGKLVKIPTVNIKYATGSAYQYKSIIIDTFEFNVAQSDVVNISCGVIGTERLNGDATKDPADFYSLRNTRVVTWNDAEVHFDGPVTVEGKEIRSFTATVNNNSARFYTLNGKLFPQDISATKRDITGNIVLMGRNTSLAERAFSNKARCTETATVTFGYQVGTDTVGSGCNGDFLVELPGVVFQIEEIAITNDLLETTINYRVMPGIPFSTSGYSTNFLQ